MAKHKVMKNQPLAKIPAHLKDSITTGPAYHQLGPGFIRRLKEMIETAECGPGQKLQQKQMAELLGMPKSTLHDWLEGQMPEQIQALICGFERLSETERRTLLRDFCRDCPRVDHPAIVHDPNAVTRLKEILERPTGLTWICGPSRRHRTFILNALGNASRLNAPSQRIVGFDTKPPRIFAPVPGVWYSRQEPEPEWSSRLVNQIWPWLLNSDFDVLILNGVISVAPHLLTDVLRISDSRRVLLADEHLAELPNDKATVLNVVKRDSDKNLTRLHIQRLH